MISDKFIHFFCFLTLTTNFIHYFRHHLFYLRIFNGYLYLRLIKGGTMLIIVEDSFR